MSKVLKNSLVFSFLVFVSMPTAMADKGQFYFAPGLQWGDFDADNELDEDWGYFGGFGYQLTDRIAAELSTFDLDGEDALGNNFDLDHWKVDLLYDLNDNSNRLTPFIVGGLGNVNFQGENDAVFDIGAGVKYEIIDNLEWRTAIRKFGYVSNSRAELDWGIDSSLVFYFGGNGSSSPRTSQPESPSPSRAPEPAPEPEPERDADRDGVVDSRDNCPNTPLSYAVDNNGCPIPVEEVARVELLVNFDFDRSEVKPEYFSEIGEVAEFLENYPDLVVELEGHTDSRGTEAYNEGLSQRRADAVRDVMIDRFDIAGNRITATGFGESQPIASNNTDAGRAENRRVITVIISTVQNYRPR